MAVIDSIWVHRCNICEVAKPAQNEGKGDYSYVICLIKVMGGRKKTMENGEGVNTDRCACGSILTGDSGKDAIQI